MLTEEKLSAILRTLPPKPGVYQFFDFEGSLLYVGKAKSLKNRVTSYFRTQHTSGRIRVMVSKIEEIRFTVVETELDALLLENNLIKEQSPRYNIMLRDDKTYPWICIKNETFPRIFPTRRKIKDGSEYYGPYPSVKVMNTLLAMVKQIYPLRTCSLHLSQENIEAKKFKVCLEFHLKNCLGPCVGLQQEEDYLQYIANVKSILKGNLNEVKSLLHQRMITHAEKMEFEQAQWVKERIEVLERYQAKSTVVSPTVKRADVFSIVSDIKSGFVNYLKVVDGAIVNSFTLEIKKRLEEPDEVLLEFGITELLTRFESDTKEIIVPFEPEFGLENKLITVPQRGDKKSLLELSERNAKAYMIDKNKQQAILDPEAHTKRILEQVKKDLRLLELPAHIECFDNSNFQGTNAVAACVVFKNAKPSKKDYRHFNIKTVEGPDDFASMTEVVYRRYKRLLDEEESLPQLIVIDGGKGQLGAALEALEQLELRGKIAIIGIAKRLEEIYFPGDSVPLYLDKRSESLKLIQQLRNEAHRFGITHHRNKRSKEALRSELTDIKGVGQRTAQTLLNHFKSVKRISESDFDSLTKVVNHKAAKLVFEHFNVK
ncbi:MAG: excinuclease ABC subunit UvrC [Luteibaculaceae bacterium]